MLNRTIIATTAVALLLGLRASAAEISWIEKLDLDHGRVEAWIEDGWLHAQRVDGSDDLIWHVVLGQVSEEAVVSKGAVPTIQGGSTVEVRHPNGRYFVRDIANQRFNCVRQKLSEGEFAGIDTDFLADAQSGGWGTGSDLGIAVENLDDYQWVLLGPAHSVGEGEESHLEIAPNAVLRMTPTLQEGRYARFSTSGAGMIDYSYNKAELSDDGEFLQARYVGMAEAERALSRSKLEKGSIPPELAMERWVNPMPTEQLENMSQAPVILIDFWATWCTPCVAEMPTVQALYDQYAEQGFMVVAVHSAHQSQDMDDFVAEHGYTMPIVLDTGETYRRFGVEGIPQYVLIGRDGRLAETGLLGSVPSAEQIEALLAAN